MNPAREHSSSNEELDSAIQQLLETREKTRVEIPNVQERQEAFKMFFASQADES